MKMQEMRPLMRFDDGVFCEANKERRFSIFENDFWVSWSGLNSAPLHMAYVMATVLVPILL
jgi:hypothetical protein